MNSQPSPSGRTEDEGAGSPKRKKVRAKYAPKACVSCRRSKLKCSGENPCQRCRDNGRRCFYSEDQTAAEALQNLSRPTASHSPHLTNGNGVARRNILPRHNNLERRASDASSLGQSMEARMARIEGMMEALVQDRGAGMTPRGSMEREESLSDGFQGDISFQAPIEALGANLAAVRQQLGFPQDSAESRRRRSLAATSSQSSMETSSIIRIGSRSLVFPSPVDYQKYVDVFFDDINPCHPCVNEVDFRTRGEQMLVVGAAHPSDTGVLALNYIIFACVDILTDTGTSSVETQPPGWRWYHMADELIGKRKINGQGDLTLVQFLIFEALYFTYADRPNTAYNVIGLACRLCFQFSLHKQSSWSSCSPYEIHMRQRIFWTLYAADRQIALSCGRPYGIRDLDVDVQIPSYIYDRDLRPGHPLPPEDLLRSANMFLFCMISWAKFVGDAWDQVFCLTATKTGVSQKNVATLDARIKQWIESTSRSIPLLPPGHAPESRHIHQDAIIYTRFYNLRLLLRRHTMISLQYDSDTGATCGLSAQRIVTRIKHFAAEAKSPSSFRFHMTASLGGAILILCTLLVRDLASLDLERLVQVYASEFQDAVNVLHDLATHFQLARRVAEDFKGLVEVVNANLSQLQVLGAGENGCANAVLGNVNELIPYGELDFAQQSRMHPGLEDYGSGASANDVVVDPSLEAWDFGDRGGGGYGVPWI